MKGGILDPCAGGCEAGCKQGCSLVAELVVEGFDMNNTYSDAY